MEIKQLEGCIRHWEAVLLGSRYLLSPGTQGIIEQTIQGLKELQKLKAKGE